MGDLITTDQITDRVLARHPDLPALISEASDLIEAWCNRTFAFAADLVESHDGGDVARIWLRRPPIASVTSVVLNGTAIDNTDGYAWTIQPDTGELRRGPPWGDVRFCARFPRGLQNVVVAYAGGFTTIPPRVQRATKILVKHLAESSRATGLYRREKLASYEYEINPDGEGLPRSVLRLIEGFVLE